MQTVFIIIGAVVFLSIVYIGIRSTINRLSNIPLENDFYDDPDRPKDGEN